MLKLFLASDSKVAVHLYSVMLESLPVMFSSAWRLSLLTRIYSMAGG